MNIMAKKVKKVRGDINSRNRDVRKVYQENGNLFRFAEYFKDDDEYQIPVDFKGKKSNWRVPLD